MTRGMLVTVLWRLDGETAPKTATTFTDVDANAYYADAVAWAAESGIVNGIGGNKFDPEGNVTREQIAAILFRYAAFKGVDTAARADLTAFPDAEKTSAYARDALSWPSPRSSSRARRKAPRSTLTRRAAPPARRSPPSSPAMRRIS